MRQREEHHVVAGQGRRGWCPPAPGRPAATDAAGASPRVLPAFPPAVSAPISTSGCAEQQPEQLAPGVSAGSRHRDPHHAHDYARSWKIMQRPRTGAAGPPSAGRHRFHAASHRMCAGRYRDQIALISLPVGYGIGHAHSMPTCLPAEFVIDGRRDHQPRPAGSRPRWLPAGGARPRRAPADRRGFPRRDRRECTTHSTSCCAATTGTRSMRAWPNWSTQLAAANERIQAAEAQLAEERRRSEHARAAAARRPVGAAAAGDRPSEPARASATAPSGCCGWPRPRRTRSAARPSRRRPRSSNGPAPTPRLHRHEIEQNLIMRATTARPAGQRDVGRPARAGAGRGRRAGLGAHRGRGGAGGRPARDGAGPQERRDRGPRRAGPGRALGRRAPGQRLRRGGPAGRPARHDAERAGSAVGEPAGRGRGGVGDGVRRRVRGRGHAPTTRRPPRTRRRSGLARPPGRSRPRPRPRPPPARAAGRRRSRCSA